MVVRSRGDNNSVSVAELGVPIGHSIFARSFFTNKTTVGVTQSSRVNIYRNEKNKRIDIYFYYADILGVCCVYSVEIRYNSNISNRRKKYLLS